MKGELSPNARCNTKLKMNLKCKLPWKWFTFARSYNSFNSNNHQWVVWMCRKIIQYTLARLWVYEYDLYQMCMWESHLSIKDIEVKMASVVSFSKFNIARLCSHWDTKKVKMIISMHLRKKIIKDNTSAKLKYQVGQAGLLMIF